MAFAGVRESTMAVKKQDENLVSDVNLSSSEVSILCCQPGSFTRHVHRR